MAQGTRHRWENATRRQSSGSRSLQTGTRLQEELSETNIQSLCAFGHGRFQRTVLLCAQVATMLAYSYSFALVLDLEPADHWCAPLEQFTNVSVEEWKDAAVPQVRKGEFKQCVRHDPALVFRHPSSMPASFAPDAAQTGEAQHIASLPSPVAGEGYNVSEVPCESFSYAPGTPGRNAVARWDLVCNKSWYQTAVMAAYRGASAVVVPCAGVASDMLGRRPVLLLALVVLVGSGVATCLAASAEWYLVLRSLSAAAGSAMEVISFILLFESTQPGPRSPFCALAVCWPTVLAPIYVGSVAFLAQEWSTFNAALLLPSVLLLVTACLVDESPHWLLASLRFDDAERVALYAARFNDEDTERVHQRIENIRLAAALNTPGSAAAALVQIAKRSLGASLLTGGMGPRFLVFCTAWFSLYLAYYTGWATDTRTFSRQFELAKWVVVTGNTPAMAVAYFVVKHHNRVSALVLFMSTVAILLAVQSAVAALGMNFPLAVAAIWKKLLLNIAYVVLCVHTVDAFPTQIRSVGYSGAYTCGRLGATAASGLKRIAEKLPGNIKTLPLAMSSVALAASALLLLNAGEKGTDDAAMMVMMTSHPGPKEPRKPGKDVLAAKTAAIPD
ncbi:solute carrier family 22 member 7-like [Amblyomma americanum]